MHFCAIDDVSPQGGNRIEIMLSGRKRGYGGMKLDPIVVEKR